MKDFIKIYKKKHNIYGRNFKNFSDWNNILLKDDHSKSLNNLHIYVNNIVDYLAPTRKLSKKELRLKGKPWITMEIQQEIYKRNKIWKKYSKRKKCSSDYIHLFKEYKTIRNKITNIYFENNRNKWNNIWKGIRSIVNINTKSRKDIQIINNKGSRLTDLYRNQSLKKTSIFAILFSQTEKIRKMSLFANL